MDIDDYNSAGELAADFIDRHLSDAINRALKAVADDEARLRRMAQEAADFTKHIPDFATSAAEANAILTARLEDPLAEFEKLKESFAREAQEIFLRLCEAEEESKRAIKDWEEQEKRTKALHRELSKRGWYVTGHILWKDGQEMLQESDGGGFDHIDDIAASFARSRVDSVLERIREKWPERAPIISDAIDAHNLGKYSLSVPTFLAQADGMSHDVLGVGFFDVGKQKGDIPFPKTKKIVQELRKKHEGSEDDSFEAGIDSLYGAEYLELLFCLHLRIDDWKEMRESDSSIGSLNRHAVLHGRDSSYPTEPNSLRCILLLDFICDIREVVQGD